MAPLRRHTFDSTVLAHVTKRLDTLYRAIPTHSSLNRYGSGSGGSGGEGVGSGGGGAPQGCSLLRPRVNICWKLMSVWVQLSTQSAMPMVTATGPPAAAVGAARLRAPRFRMLDSRGSRMSRVGSPDRRESSFAFTCSRKLA